MYLFSTSMTYIYMEDTIYIGLFFKNNISRISKAEFKHFS